MGQDTISLDLNGYTDLPRGKLAAVVTYLEMTQRPDLPVDPRPNWFTITAEPGIALDEYRRVFRLVGERWLWFSRLLLSDEALQAVLTATSVELYFLRQDGEAQGILELDFREDREVEITFLGVSPALVGKGAGSVLMRFALDRAWKSNPGRVWLHTCTLDHPGALDFYCKFGFRPYRRALEIADDPRVIGKINPGTAPQIPLL